MSILIDLTGKAFGRWTVLGCAPSKSGRTMFRCRCQCGTESEVAASNLKSGISQSCGCLKTERTSARCTLDLTGQRFGRLVAMKQIGTKNGYAMWECACDCGQRSTLSSNRIRTGNTRSCGCLRADSLSARATHGATRRDSARRPEYRTWAGAIDRCVSVTNSRYSSYGGRGIAVCEQWRHSFETFLADMGPRPSPKHSLDRINNDGNYEPSNCRWATQKQQQANKRTNLIVEYRGRRRSLPEWAEELGIDFKALARRIYSGWPAERAFTQPVRRSALHPTSRTIAERVVIAEAA